MIIRVRTNLGLWRVDSLSPSSTVNDILAEIAKTKPGISYSLPLSLDSDCKQPLQINDATTLDNLGLKHGSMIYCRVDPASVTSGSGASSSSNNSLESTTSQSNEKNGIATESKKRKYNATIDLTDSNDDGGTYSLSRTNSNHQHLPFGTFQGLKIYRNSLHPGETFDQDHVSIHNLIPSDCDKAIVTTFEWPEESFIPQVFGSNDLNISDLLIVRHDNRPKGLGRCLLGDAEVTPITGGNCYRNWHYATCAPHTSGFLHGKLLLLRSKCGGLRVVVSGNNLYQKQWEEDRDVIWAQDFPFFANHNNELGENERHNAGPFEARLREFMTRITQCQSGNQSVQQRIHTLFQNVDFSNARGRLVFSFPGSKEDRGGWKQLASAVNELIGPRRDAETESDSDSDFYERKPKSNPNRTNCNNDSNESNDTQKSSHPILYATSGCMGDVKPEFLLQMHRAMMGDDEQIPKQTDWDDILSTSNRTGDAPRIGLVRCMWPGRDLALQMTMRGICSGRAMSRKHWYNNIPEFAKRRLFFDAPPNPALGLPQYGKHCRIHGKMMYMSIPTMSQCVLYVGSHNFSEAAWGVRGNQPKNVEIGVVLVTKSHVIDQQWRDCLPCVLPNEYGLSPDDYVPIEANETVKQLYQSGLVDEAERAFRISMVKASTSSSSTSTVSNAVEDNRASAPTELIDLCDSD